MGKIVGSTCAKGKIVAEQISWLVIQISWLILGVFFSIFRFLYSLWRVLVFSFSADFPSTGFLIGGFSYRWGFAVCGLTKQKLVGGEFRALCTHARRLPHCDPGPPIASQLIWILIRAFPPHRNDEWEVPSLFSSR